MQSALRGEVQRGGAKGCKAERREGLRATSSSLLAYQEENINKTPTCHQNKYTEEFLTPPRVRFLCCFS